MAKTKRLSDAKVAEAITKTHGIIAATAESLGYSRSLISARVNKSEKLQEVLKQARESMIDFTESQLFKNIRAGDNASIFFYLKTQAKHRGYVERVERYEVNETPDEVVIE